MSDRPTPPPRVLITRPLADDLLEPLAARAALDRVRSPEGLAQDELVERAQGCAGILCQLVDRIDAAVLDAAAPTLRVVSSVSVGLDHVDLEAAERHGVTVHNTPGVLTEATADLAFGLLVAAARRIVEADRYVRDGRWDGWKPDLMLGRELHGSTVGVVGFGRIGRAFARRAAGFGMEVLCANRSPVDAAVLAESGARQVDLDTLCARSDFVSLHVPGTPRTHHLFDRSRLASCKPGAILVNTARGSVVDEEALVEALGPDGPLGGAGLDVFEREPRVHPELLELPHVVLAPHIGSATHTTRHRMAQLAVSNLLSTLGSA